MFCSNCGKQIKDGAKFCGFCGSPQAIVRQDVVYPNSVSQPTYNYQPVSNTPKDPAVEGKKYKCPYCGDFLPFDAIVCPSCHNEIRDRQSFGSINELLSRIRAEDDLKRKIELIQLYPIPNSREAIFEFMLVASSQFDPEIYAGHPAPDSLPGAWLSQIELCYKKGKIMFTDPTDLDKLERLYRSIKGKDGAIAKETNRRKFMLFLGIAAIVGGTLLLLALNAAGLVTSSRETGTTPNDWSTFIGYIPLIIITGGILALTVGRKRKRSNSEIQQEKEQKIARQRAKLEAERARLDELERRSQL